MQITRNNMNSVAGALIGFSVGQQLWVSYALWQDFQPGSVIGNAIGAVLATIGTVIFVINLAAATEK